MRIIDVQTVFSQQNYLSKMTAGKGILHSNLEFASQEKSIEKSLRSKDKVQKTKAGGESEILHDNETAVKARKKFGHPPQKEQKQEQEQIEIIQEESLGKKFDTEDIQVLDVYKDNTINIVS